MTTRNTIALTIWTLMGKVMSLLFNALSWFAMAFLPRSKHLLNFMVAVTIHSDFGQNSQCDELTEEAVAIKNTEQYQSEIQGKEKQGDAGFYKARQTIF